ncbi:hypothetical protein BaRGS_00035797 [Batillaria attramentaria]|uniref:Uncharacterized protein n=1 Tax=Batillaria attramentaria TaxID=370345 RepID=A0ABD0JDT5_9CAEN
MCTAFSCGHRCANNVRVGSSVPRQDNGLTLNSSEERHRLVPLLGCSKSECDVDHMGNDSGFYVNAFVLTQCFASSVEKKLPETKMDQTQEQVSVMSAKMAVSDSFCGKALWDNGNWGLHLNRISSKHASCYYKSDHQCFFNTSQSTI